MTIAFTTDTLAHRDRIPYWVDVASKAFFEHGFSAKPLDFSGRLDARPLGSMMLSSCACGPCRVTRTRRDISRDGVEDFILCIRLAGSSVLTQGSRKVLINPGTVVLQDCGRPLDVEFLDLTSSIFVSLPRREVLTRIGDAGAERIASTGTPMGQITSDFVRALADNMHALDPAAHQGLARQTLELVAFTFGAGDTGAPLTTPRAAALSRLKQEIEHRLADPSLTPAAAAAAAGISVRYANVLLAKEGSSLERYILRCRLERCRSALEDPLQSHRMIGEIAFSWGFSDHSHFTRRFRAMFGMPPGECRELAKVLKRSQMQSGG